MEALLIVVLKISAVAILVLLNGFFVAAEFAIVKIRDTQLTPLIARGRRRAVMVRHIIHHVDAYLSAAQLGITMASLALGWIGEPVFKTLLQPLFSAFGIVSETVKETMAFGIGFTLITFLHIVAGEQAPKSFAIKHSLQTALWVSYPMKWFYSAAYPLIWILNESSLRLLKWLGIESSPDGDMHSEDEVRLLVGALEMRRGGSGSDIAQIVNNAFDLRRRTAREILRPRKDITVIDTDADIRECLDVAETTKYSRFPLCEGGDLDKTVGVVHVKDLYSMRQTAHRGRDLSPSARKMIYVPEMVSLEKLLQMFLKRKLHLALVVNEYGGVVGLVTLENILEELVGPIQDEFDQEKSTLVRIDERTWQLAGEVALHELEEITDLALQEKGITTIGGFMTARLEGFPKVGDMLMLGSFRLSVEEMDGMKVRTLKLYRAAGPEDVDRPKI